MVKIGVDAGHGLYTSGKRTPDDEREWTFNDKVVKAFIKELQTYQNVEVKRFDDATGKTDVSLNTRTNNAKSWGADVYLSFHHNANTSKWGTWTGVETHVYTTKPARSVALAKVVQPALVKAYGLKDRGIKYTNLHITRELRNTCPVVLVEGGFMDSTIDIKKLRNNAVLETAGKEIAVVVAKFMDLEKKAATPEPTPPQTSNHIAIGEITTDVWSQKQPSFSETGRVKVLEKGTRWKVYGEENDYYKVGTSEWVNKKYMKLVEEQKYVEILSDVWSQRNPYFSETGRVQILKKGAVYKAYGEKDGYNNLGSEWVNQKYAKYVTKQ